MFIAVGVQKLVRSKKQSKGSVIILDLNPKNHIANTYLSLYFANISVGESLKSLFCSNFRCIWSSIRVSGTFIGVTDLDRWSKSKWLVCCLCY